MSLTTIAVIEAPPVSLDSGETFRIESFDRSTANVDELVKSLKRNGGVRLRNFLNADEIESYEKIASGVLSNLDFQDPSDTTKRITRLPLHMPELVERVLTDDIYLGVCDAMLSSRHKAWIGNRLVAMEDMPIVQMTTAFAVAPGTGAQDLHRDDNLYHNRLETISSDEYTVGRDKAISFFIAGRKTTKHNGATNVIPGSHLQASDTPPDPSKAIPAEMDAGDAFIMLASTYHGAGHNSTKDQERLVYGIFMMQPTLRQEENLYLAIPPEQIKKFSSGVQKRLGYDLCMPYLGWIDYESPLKAVLGMRKENKTTSVLTYNDAEGKEK